MTGARIGLADRPAVPPVEPPVVAPPASPDSAASRAGRAVGADAHGPLATGADGPAGSASSGESGATRGGETGTGGGGGTAAGPTAGDTYGRGTGDEGCGTTVDDWPSADGMPSESDPAALAASTSPVRREGEAGSTRIGVAGGADGCRPSEPLCSDSAKSWALRCRAAGNFAIAVRNSA